MYGTAAGYTQEHSPAIGAELTVQLPYELDEHEIRQRFWGHVLGFEGYGLDGLGASEMGHLIRRFEASEARRRAENHA